MSNTLEEQQHFGRMQYFYRWLQLLTPSNISQAGIFVGFFFVVGLVLLRRGLGQGEDSGSGFFGLVLLRFGLGG